MEVESQIQVICSYFTIWVFANFRKKSNNP